MTTEELVCAISESDFHRVYCIVKDVESEPEFSLDDGLSLHLSKKYTPLGEAITAGRHAPELVAFLCAHGASPHVMTNWHGRCDAYAVSPLYLAAARDLRTMQVLLCAGAGYGYPRGGAVDKHGQLSNLREYVAEINSRYHFVQASKLPAWLAKLEHMIRTRNLSWDVPFMGKFDDSNCCVRQSAELRAVPCSSPVPPSRRSHAA